MTKPSPHERSRWIGCLLIAAAFGPSCANETPTSDDLQLEVNESTEALTQAEFDCERTKRECLVTADCDDAMRRACESAFRECKEPVRAEKDRVREMCRAERETCEEAATDEAAHHACHIAAHECSLAVDPPEAVCHIDALKCRGPKEPKADPPMPTDRDADRACREAERECKESRRLDRHDLPEAPKCPPLPPPPPRQCTPEEPADADPPVMDSQSHFECERTKRECLVAADCDPDAREACKSAFRACEEPIRTEKERVHEMCRAARETCDATATDEAAHHACHMAEHECRLPVEPPEAVCRIDAEECRWAARSAPDATPAPDPAMPAPPMRPIPTPSDPAMPPDPMTRPEPKMHPERSAAEQACRDTERACVESMRMRPEDLPTPPHCPPAPACTPDATP